MTAVNTAFTVFSGIGFLLSVIPIYWHLDSWQVGTGMYMIWTALGCLVYFVDSIVWSGNTINWAPVWCDIATRIQLAVAVAWPACGLCIVRRLYSIASATAVTTNRAQKRREMVIELLLAIGLPVLQIPVQYIVSGHRFDIFEDFGCAPVTWNTHLAFVLVSSWPLILGVISAIYGYFTIRTFTRRRKQIRDLLATKGNLAYNRYRRLTVLASLDFVFTIPLATWALVQAPLRSEVDPWVSWAETHWGYSRVSQYPRVVLNQDSIAVIGLETTRWSAVLCAFVFFFFFGFSDEAKENYRLLAHTVTRRFGSSTSTESAAISDSMVCPGIESKGGTSFPVFIIQKTKSEADSFDLSPDKFSTLSSVIYSVNEVPRVPESALDPALVRRPPVPGDPKSVCPDKAFDQV